MAQVDAPSHQAPLSVLIHCPGPPILGPVDVAATPKRPVRSYRVVIGKRAQIVADSHRARREYASVREGFPHAEG
jgi:hypothetical protein